MKYRQKPNLICSTDKPTVFQRKAKSFMDKTHQQKERYFTMALQIQNKTFDEERALYHLQDAEVLNCDFSGPADGESALKESRNVTVKNCRLSLRYHFWHTEVFRLDGSTIDTSRRAPIWYASDGKIIDTLINGVKCLRECRKIELEGCTVSSPEFGWRCRDLSITDCAIESEYFLFESSDIEADRLKMKGKYSFQYVKSLHINHSELDTKDAFWHSENVIVENSTVKGEYLGWYSDGLTLINCKIIGTQPLCYCKNLKLINCTMEDTDLSFEYSEVEADVKGAILSVKNPKSGKIAADQIGEVILEDSILESTCLIETRS